MSLRRTATSTALGGILLLIQTWLAGIGGAHSILVVSALVGAASYGAVMCTTTSEQRRALWRLLAHRMPVYGARS